jgi:AcrR family transcriptional regulator
MLLLFCDSRMDSPIVIKASDKLFTKDPGSSDLGKKIVAQSVVLIDKLGFEAFTFAKLARNIGTTEASVYRYFENKQRLLQYLMQLYWHWMEYQLVFRTYTIKSTKEKISEALRILVTEADEDTIAGISSKLLRSIVIAESAKAYLNKEVEEDNRNQLFKPYKDLCSRLAELFLERNPAYRYARSLASTIIEMSHLQIYFRQHLPSLTDFSSEQGEEAVIGFLQHLTDSCLRKN